MSILELLSHHGIAYDQKETDNVYIECPDCAKVSLSINVFSGLWHCWNSICEEAGNRGGFPLLIEKLKLEGDVQFTAANPPPKKDRSLSDEDAKAILHANTNRAEVIEWAASRGLDSSFVLEQGIGYEPKVKAIVFPFRDQKGNLIGAKFRGTNGDQWIKGMEPLLYLLDCADLAKEKIVIVEGEVDALTLKQAGIPCVATLGASKDKGLGLLAGVRQVYLGYDMDAAGEVGVEKAATALGRYRCKRITWTLKDPNDMIQTGMGRDELLTCIKEAKSLATDIKSKTGVDTMQEYLTMLNKAPRKRLSWGYPNLDRFTQGIGGGMYIGVLAEAGTGKTTFIINAARNNAQAGINVGICSLEEHVVNEITPKLGATLVGRNPGAGGFSAEEIEAIQKQLGRIQLYDGDESCDSIVDWIKECYYVHDVKILFIDYLQLMVSDEKDVEQLKRTCYRFKKLVKELPELCIVMIIQPKQRQKTFTKDGKEAKPMTMDGSDARGGAAINQSVDAMLTIKVVEGQSNITQFQYTKVRGHLRVSKKDWIGQFTQLEYDHATLRQTELNHMIYGGTS